MSDELALVEKVELRLALADTDQKFETSLDSYLAPILLKFASPNSDVRAQINKMVKYLLTRINSSNVKLPVLKLLQQVKNPSLSPNVDPTVVQSYTLVFISKGLPRLSQKEKTDLIPIIIDGISTVKPLIAARLFNILCKALLDLDVKDTEKESYRASLNINETDKQFLLEKFYEFMLLGTVLPDESHSIPQTVSFPGLSAQKVAFFTYQAGATFDLGTLISYKKAIFKFAETVFPESNALIAIVASADTSNSLANDALSFLKRNKIDHEDQAIVDKLISLFIGDETVEPAGVYLQEKIMNFCCQSRKAVKSPDSDKLCSMGLESEYPKLKQATIRFIKWISTVLVDQDDATDENLCKSIALQLKDNLSQEDVTTSNTIQQRFQYEALSVVLRRITKLENCEFIDFLFRMLEREPVELRSSIQDSLSSLAPSLHTLPPPEQQTLKQILASYISVTPASKPTEGFTSCRYMAVKYVNSCFAFNDPQARILDIFAQTQFDRPETIEEAGKGLHPYYFSLLQSFGNSGIDSAKIEFPSFVSILDEAQKSEHVNFDKELNFAWKCLVMQAIKGQTTVIVADQQWDTRLENALDYDEKVKQLVVDEMKRLDSVDLNGESALLSFLEKQLDVFVTYSSLETGKVLYQALVSSPANAVSKLSGYIDKLKSMLNVSVSDEVLLYASKSLAIIGSHSVLPNSELVSLLQDVLKKEHISALCFLISQLVLQKRLDVISDELFTSVLSKINDDMLSSSTRAQRGALEGLSQLSLFGCLGPVVSLSASTESFKTKFVENLLPLVKKFNERATTALSCLTLSLEVPEADSLSPIESVLYETHVSKQTDFHFTSGEAFTIIAAGSQSKVVDSKLDIRDHSFEPQLVKNLTRLPLILDTIIQACANTKPSLRRAGCIWLLSFVQHCGHLEYVKTKLDILQKSFSRFLADKDEIIQESASRGLSIVYEMGDADLKDTLTHNLLSSFTDSGKSISTGFVHEDTELFDPGVMNTGDSSVSTYKDVLSLASEVGDPSLVYKFMSLAKNSALWSSKKGIAFGLGAILDKTKLENLIANDDKLSSRLIPKLFRYRFDPSPSVARTMNDIWTSLLPNSNVVTDNFDAILKDLLLNMGNREWRVRQASASAAQDLLRLVSFDRYESQLEKIWTMSFRVMDDIKESVRLEGNSLTRYLATTMVNKISSATTPGTEDSKILSQLVPFLLGPNGLLNDSDDLKNFALEIVIKLSKSSSLLLKPFICDMVEQLVIMMSSIEPQIVNYLALNADKYNMKSDDIDSHRLHSIGSSPLMEAIEQLMNLLDDNLMPDFVTHLSNGVKKSVGLPSKVTGSKIIITLITRHYFVAQKYGDELLKICMGQLKDRNETVSRSYAISAGYCVRVASLKRIESLSKKLTGYYFEAGDNERLRILAANTSESISRYSTDKFQSVAVNFLPLAFIGKHDPVKEVGSAFSKEWEDSTSGGSGPVKLYLKEIIGLIRTHIDSTNFQIRQSIALSIIEIVDRLGNELNSLGQYLGDLYDILLVSLKGRSYKGKENLLKSLILLAIKTPNYFNDNEAIFNNVKHTVLVEARRKNKEYSVHSVRSLGVFLGAFPDEDVYQEYLELVTPFIVPKTQDGSDMDTDSEEEEPSKANKKAKDARLEDTKILFLENLVDALNTSQPEPKLVSFIMSNLVDYFQDNRYQQTYKTQLAIIKAFKDLLVPGVLDQVSKQELFEIWKVISDNCANRENLQNVLVAFIRTTQEFQKSCSEFRSACSQKLEALAGLNINSVINKEIENALHS
ncbi:hypothetical protein OGAPHI_002673 [Ogataea philodendri]|uniref:Proteasome component ECM29 n=2 Tax=Saccharomycotina TaxID=147537 RepID=A0A9P8PAY0_9ASCO|nr:uncharacterized protein OGAPHI_002673 [Ogataea philodendri]KAH3668918.1 hypothetical protein OGAPHI_002673 [Ogataea philodendri]